MYLSVLRIVARWLTACYANSSTMLARIAAASVMSEFFGIYAHSDTAKAFLRPLLVGYATWLFQGQRIGFASILLLLGIGLAGMLFVKEERAEAVD